MPKFLVQASYTAEGAKGVLKEGGSARRATIEKMIKAVGGKVEAFYFAFGKDDVIIIGEVPDNATAAALSLTVGATGTAHTRTTILVTAEEVDQAAKKSIDFRKAGA
jgi:uncharacterized protein with GYD domain